MKWFMLTAVACASTVVAQDIKPAAIPVRKLGAITATTVDTLSFRLVVRPLSDGRVLVNDASRKRVLLYDATLQHSVVILDSIVTDAMAAGSPGVSLPSGQLIPYSGDSTLFVDLAAKALIIIDPQGKTSRVMALPRPGDAIFLATAALTGSPATDPKGRLVYRGVRPPPPFKMPTPGTPMDFSAMNVRPDSAPIVRADFDSRKVDTLISVKVFNSLNSTTVRDADRNSTVTTVLNTVMVADDWAMTSDGAVAVVRVHDYHIDWIDADGTKRSTPKMPFDWKRLTDEDKQHKIDSIKPMIDRMNSTKLPPQPQMRLPDGSLMGKMTMVYVPPSIKDMPDFEPPIRPGSVKADLAGNLWIVPRTAVTNVDDGLRYDVVNKAGVIVERVVFPKGRALAAFGPGGLVYMTNVRPSGAATIERATLR